MPTRLSIALLGAGGLGLGLWHLPEWGLLEELKFALDLPAVLALVVLINLIGLGVGLLAWLTYRWVRDGTLARW